MRPIALLWDHDGVLVDTEHLYFQATRELLSEVGVQLDESLYRQLFLVEGTGAWHLAAERGVDESEIARLKQRRSDRYSELLRAHDVLVPGVLPRLATLAERYRMAIVTSSHRVHFATIHEQTTLERHFEFVLAREDYVCAKPDPEPYATAVARLGLSPEQCLAIEDSERGLRAAVGAGVRCWTLSSPLTEASDFSRAERRFDGLPALCSALLALC
jgi:HAD superfamily hydrolase (TIGR01509 family)